MLNIEKIQITTLSENSVADIDYIAEWGFSVHIAIEGGSSILFDTGNGQTCTFNAEAAGIRLSAIDLIVLSHGHTDHTGGLRAVLQKIRYERPERLQVDILCHPAALESQYVKHTDYYFYRGCPHHIEELTRLGAHFRASSEPVWIREDIVTSGEIPMKTDFESVAPICFLKKGDGYVESSVTDDQALFLMTNKGLIIILGCAHRGMINTIIHAKELTGMDEIYLVIGGTHLLNTSEAQQQATLEAIERFGVKKLGVSHCTGMRPASFLFERLGSKRFFFNNAGTGIIFKEDTITVKAFEKHDV
jgi:7,8-dihydropterin-6-yl-methyl-4-(beta-D-ribofuranosyl)aminobenzene 5'-phosphate synthase